jgi:exopolysaccharide biosynthesis protein
MLKSILGYEIMDLKQKTRNKILYLSHFIICILVFMPLFTILLIYHGPFVNLKEYIVTTSMATNKNKFFATWFLSASEISSILAKTDSIVKDSKENVNNVQVLKNVSNISSDSSNKASNKNSTKVSIIEIKEASFNAKLMIIDDPSKVSLGLSPKLGQVGAPLSEIVKLNKAIGGINAGGFLDDNLMGTGANPDGIVIQNGVVKFKQAGLSNFNIIGFNKDNVLVIGNSLSLGEINKSNLKCVISFGPALVLNGVPLVTSGGTSLQPRSAIGQRKDGTVLLLAVDGREANSAGANYKDIQNLLLKYGAYNAANLDGGSSTTMNYLGKTINNPCDITGERLIATAYLITQ